MDKLIAMAGRNLPVAGAVGVPGECRVEVVLIDLAAQPADPSLLAAQLSPAELQRAARFHFARDRQTFVTVRGYLRSLLGKAVGQQPDLLQFGYTAFGKPFLEEPVVSGLDFNVTHSGEIAAIALAWGGQVGIDLERIRPFPCVGTVVDSFFSPNESRAFRRLPLRDRPEAFFNLWTCKEAWLKACGAGIGTLLCEVEVTLKPGEPPRLQRVPAQFGTVWDWWLTEVPVPGGAYAGALAVHAPGRGVTVYQKKTLHEKGN